MKLGKVNMLTPRKILLTTMLTASLVTGASALNSTKDSFEKQQVENADKFCFDKVVSVVKDIDEYDTKIIDKISGNSEKDTFTKENKTLIRFLAGIIMSVIGGMAGNVRGEKGKKYMANPDSVSNLGFVSGFILPGIAACTTFAVSVGILLKSLCDVLTGKQRGNY